MEGHNGWRMPIVKYRLQREPPLLIASLAAASLRGCTPSLELPARVAQRAASNGQSATFHLSNSKQGCNPALKTLFSKARKASSLQHDNIETICDQSTRHGPGKLHADANQ
jgi:hypothetical protein